MRPSTAKRKPLEAIPVPLVWLITNRRIFSSAANCRTPDRHSRDHIAHYELLSYNAKQHDPPAYPVGLKCAKNGLPTAGHS